MQNRKRDTDVQNRLLDSVGEGEGGIFWEKSIETSILSSVKQITSPGWMHETSAQGWCTGKTQRDEMGREAGMGIEMGNACKSMADSCQCMAKKPLQYCKVISLQLIKINGIKKKKMKWLSVFKSPGFPSSPETCILAWHILLALRRAAVPRWSLLFTTLPASLS